MSFSLGRSNSIDTNATIDDDLWGGTISFENTFNGGSLSLDDMADGESRSISPTGLIPGADEDPPCEFGCGLAPKVCQEFRTPVCILIWLCLAAFTQGLVVNGFVNSVITSIEKRYNLLSSESGTIASMYDIAVLICLLPVSYIGGQMRKSRWIAVGLVIMGMGSFVFAIPHFTSGYYDFEKRNQPVCSALTKQLESNESLNFCDENSRTENLRLNNYKFVFWLGQFLHGVGASPIYTLGITFLDENLSTKSSAVFIGMFYTMSLFGPAIGYVLGGVFLKLYVDVNQMEPGITPENTTVWVGAWWIGFLVAGSIAWIGVIPMFGFPEHLPGSYEKRQEKKDETYHQKDDPDQSGSQDVVLDDEVRSGGATPVFHLNNVIPAAKSILGNPTFVCLSLSGASELVIATSLSTFLPKFLESSFGVTPDWSPILIGLCSVPAGGLGMFLGGLIIRLRDMSVTKILKMCIIVTVAVFPFFFGFLMSCETSPMAGVTTPYQSNNSKEFSSNSKNLTSICNDNCGCSSDFYFYRPVCGSNNITYFSPCHAGCSVNTNHTYKNCSCVQSSFPTNSNWTATAVDGACLSDCMMEMVVFLVILCLIIFGTFLTQTPSLTATLRSLAYEDRSFGLGIQWIFLRLLGSIPGPLMFGALIDTTCSLWKTQCDSIGSCVFYDPKKFRIIFMGMSLVLKVISFLLLMLAYFFYRQRRSSSKHTLKRAGYSADYGTPENQNADDTVPTIS